MAALSHDLGEDEFARIADFARSTAGIVLDAGKRSMVQSRLSKRVRRLGLPGFAAYVGLIEAPQGADERKELISLLTTNVTGFFRENHHFDFLADVMLPPLVERLRAGGRVRIWSAGCSLGNEPYSIAMICREAIGERDDLDLKILATDIDMHAVATAARGVFDDETVSALPAGLRHRYMERDRDTPGGWLAGRAIRSLVTFRELNLMGAWPMNGPFDIVFCRNVVIYFDADGQDRLCRRLAGIIPAGGWLCIGHSERISPGAQGCFESKAITTYLRTPG